MNARKIAPATVAAKTSTKNPPPVSALAVDPATRRKSERSILMLDPLLLDKDGRVLARIADISIDGALLCSKGEPFAVGTRLSGWLDAPALGAFKEEFVAIWLTVAWSKPEGPAGWFKAGCVFEHGDNAEAMRLASLIDALRDTQP